MDITEIKTTVRKKYRDTKYKAEVEYVNGELNSILIRLKDSIVRSIKLDSEKDLDELIDYLTELKGELF